MIILMLAAILLAVLANDRAELRQLLEARRIKGSEPRESAVESPASDARSRFSSNCGSGSKPWTSVAAP